MKKIVFLLLMLLTSKFCNSQTIFPLYDTGWVNHKNGFYYKDIKNFHDQYVGSWVFNDSLTYLKVVFKKKTMFLEKQENKTYYVDYLVGEYEYKVNNVTIVNTLKNIDLNHHSIFNYNMISLYKYKINQYPECDGCDITNRLVMYFQELPTRDPQWAAGAYFIIRREIKDETNKLRVQFIHTDSAGAIPSGLRNEYKHFSIPYGEYTFVKE